MASLLFRPLIKTRADSLGFRASRKISCAKGVEERNSTACVRPQHLHIPDQRGHYTCMNKCNKYEMRISNDQMALAAYIDPFPQGGKLQARDYKSPFSRLLIIHLNSER
ncbi:hypothetical protein E4U53_001282 [Claviceps sorghi]|nr:hypothetical protein E4U53_001282 [Claviceps sorghi]